MLDVDRIYNQNVHKVGSFFKKFFYINVGPRYCPSAILHIRPSATSDLRQLFIFVLFEGYVRLRQFLGRVLRLGRARGPSAAAVTG